MLSEKSTFHPYFRVFSIDNLQLRLYLWPQIWQLSDINIIIGKKLLSNHLAKCRWIVISQWQIYTLFFIMLHGVESTLCQPVLSFVWKKKSLFYTDFSEIFLRIYVIHFEQRQKSVHFPLSLSSIAMNGYWFSIRYQWYR